MLYEAIHVSTDVWPILQVVMRRIAIIDYTNHTLFVEDINEEILEGQYGGDVQLYIDAHYYTENYSWDWIIDAEYIREFEKYSIEINFEDIGDI